jgi:acyl carrier protein
MTTSHGPVAPAQHDILELIKQTAQQLDGAGHQELCPETKISALGLDSVSLMEMLGMIEDELRIQLPQAEFQRLKTIGDLVLLVQRELNT